VGWGCGAGCKQRFFEAATATKKPGVLRRVFYLGNTFFSRAWEEMLPVRFP
jgi:hypothetical protein